MGSALSRGIATSDALALSGALALSVALSTGVLASTESTAALSTAVTIGAPPSRTAIVFGPELPPQPTNINNAAQRTGQPLFQVRSFRTLKAKKAATQNTTKSMPPASAQWVTLSTELPLRWAT